jgi:hypothetical protein
VLKSGAREEVLKKNFCRIASGREINTDYGG